MKFNYDKTEFVKKLDMEKTLENYINNNGIAHIVYVADGINDILDRHSPEGYQAISVEFAEYVKTRLKYVKNDMPLLLEITGCRFGEEEKKHITEAIWQHFVVLLSKTNKDNRRMIVRFVFFLILLILAGIFMGIGKAGSMVNEFVVIMFWFFGDFVCEYLFVDSADAKETKIRCSKLSSMKIVFTEKFEDREFTDDEVYGFVKEIEENTKVIGLKK